MLHACIGGEGVKKGQKTACALIVCPLIAYNVRIASSKILSFAMIEKIPKYWQRDINVSSRVLRQHALMSAGVSENGCSF